MLYELSLACGDFPCDQCLLLVKSDKQIVYSFESKITRSPLHSKELNPVAMHNGQDHDLIKACLQAYSLL